MKVFVPDVFYHEIFDRPRHNYLCFHLEKDRFIEVNDPDDADIIPFIPFYPIDERSLQIEKFLKYLDTDISNKFILIIDINHISEFMSDEYMEYELEHWKKYTDKVIYLHQNKKVSRPNMIAYDYLFNRQKSYFTDYDKFDLTDRLWTYDSGKAMFKLDIDRVRSWFRSLVNLRATDKKELMEFYEKDKDLLSYNRSLFFQKPYDSLYDRLAESIDKYQRGEWS